MKVTKKRGFFLYAASALTIIALLLPVFPSSADKPQRDMRGETFTDPSTKFRMPEKWNLQTIKYEDWAKNADIAISLEQDVYQTILPLIQKYEKENEMKIAVKEGTCGIAAGMLSKKTVDIGGFCCPAGKEDRLPGLKYHTLGIVSKAYFVHPDNPVENISSADLRGIYLGKRHRWSEFKTKNNKPGPPWAIRAIGRLHCKGRPGHWRQMLDNDKLFGQKMYEVGSIPDMIAKTSSIKEAIGWEVLSMVEKYKNLGKVKVLRIDGYSPHASEALTALKYPFYRTYNITTWEGKGIENKKAQRLVDYLIKEVEKINPERFGFVSPSRLKKAGWKFTGNELTGEPK